MAFLKILFFFFLGYYALLLLLRITGPYLMRYLAKRTEKRFREAFGATGDRSRNSPQDGSVTGNIRKRGEREREPVGEYIAYEEIE